MNVIGSAENDGSCPHWTPAAPQSLASGQFGATCDGATVGTGEDTAGLDFNVEEFCDYVTNKHQQGAAEDGSTPKTNKYESWIDVVAKELSWVDQTGTEDASLDEPGEDVGLSNDLIAQLRAQIAGLKDEERNDEPIAHGVSDTTATTSSVRNPDGSTTAVIDSKSAHNFLWEKGVPFVRSQNAQTEQAIENIRQIEKQLAAPEKPHAEASSSPTAGVAKKQDKREQLASRLAILNRKDPPPPDIADLAPIICFSGEGDPLSNLYVPENYVGLTLDGRCYAAGALSYYYYFKLLAMGHEDAAQRCLEATLPKDVKDIENQLKSSGSATPAPPTGKRQTATGGGLMSNRGLRRFEKLFNHWRNNSGPVVMKKVLLAKFSDEKQPHIRQRLLETGKSLLVLTYSNRFWGVGMTEEEFHEHVAVSGTKPTEFLQRFRNHLATKEVGRNTIGLVLMEIREQFRWRAERERLLRSITFASRVHQKTVEAKRAKAAAAAQAGGSYQQPQWRKDGNGGVTGKESSYNAAGRRGGDMPERDSGYKSSRDRSERRRSPRNRSPLRFDDRGRRSDADGSRSSRFRRSAERSPLGSRRRDDRGGGGDYGRYGGGRRSRSGSRSRSSRNDRDRRRRSSPARSERKHAERNKLPGVCCYDDDSALSGRYDRRHIFTYNGAQYTSIFQHFHVQMFQSLGMKNTAERIKNGKRVSDVKIVMQMVFLYDATLGDTIPPNIGDRLDDWKKMSGGLVLNSGLYNRFSQNPDLKKLLLSTGNDTIVEATEDADWGIGLTEKAFKEGYVLNGLAPANLQTCFESGGGMMGGMVLGSNKLGCLLEKLRGQLRAAEPEQSAGQDDEQQQQYGRSRDDQRSRSPRRRSRSRSRDHGSRRRRDDRGYSNSGSFGRDIEPPPGPFPFQPQGGGPPPMMGSTAYPPHPANVQESVPPGYYPPSNTSQEQFSAASPLNPYGMPPPSLTGGNTQQRPPMNAGNLMMARARPDSRFAEVTTQGRGQGGFVGYEGYPPPSAAIDMHEAIASSEVHEPSGAAANFPTGMDENSAVPPTMSASDIQFQIQRPPPSTATSMMETKGVGYSGTGLLSDGASMSTQSEVPTASLQGEAERSMIERLYELNEQAANAAQLIEKYGSIPVAVVNAGTTMPPISWSLVASVGAYSVGTVDAFVTVEEEANQAADSAATLLEPVMQTDGAPDLDKCAKTFSGVACFGDEESPVLHNYEARSGARGTANQIVLDGEEFRDIWSCYYDCMYREIGNQTATAADCRTIEGYASLQQFVAKVLPPGSDLERHWIEARGMDVLWTALRSKFLLDSTARRLLLGTGSAYLVYTTATDNLWGAGVDHVALCAILQNNSIQDAMTLVNACGAGQHGLGKNLLGLMLCHLRTQLRVLTTCLEGLLSNQRYRLVHNGPSFCEVSLEFPLGMMSEKRLVPQQQETLAPSASSSKRGPPKQSRPSSTSKDNGTALPSAPDTKKVKAEKQEAAAPEQPQFGVQGYTYALGDKVVMLTGPHFQLSGAAMSDEPFFVAGRRYYSPLSYVFEQMFDAVGCLSMIKASLDGAKTPLVLLIEIAGLRSGPEASLSPEIIAKMADWELNDGVRAVERALVAKYSQQTELKAMLLETGNNYLVDACLDDKVWGLGLPVSSFKQYGPKVCRSPRILSLMFENSTGETLGRNYFGRILMSMRLVFGAVKKERQ